MLILCTMCLMSVSCKSLEVVSSSEVQDVQKFRSVDTVVVRDSVYRHDSVIYRERTVLDTVYITKEVYRDRLEARGECRVYRRGNAASVHHLGEVISHFQAGINWIVTPSTVSVSSSFIVISKHWLHGKCLLKRINAFVSLRHVSSDS